MDIATGWMACRAVLGKGQQRMGRGGKPTNLGTTIRQIQLTRDNHSILDTRLQVRRAIDAGNPGREWVRANRHENRRNALSDSAGRTANSDLPFAERSTARPCRWYADMSNCTRPGQTSEIERGDRVILQADGTNCHCLQDSHMVANGLDDPESEQPDRITSRVELLATLPGHRC